MVVVRWLDKVSDYYFHAVSGLWHSSVEYLGFSLISGPSFWVVNEI